MAVRIANSTDNPVLLLGNKRPDSSSLVALLATAGMLEQGGKRIKRILGDFRERKVQEEIARFISVCTLSAGLQRMNFGLIGGRSIGIGTTVADPAQWQRMWQIESDHVDQLEVVVRARAVEAGRVAVYRKWLDGLSELRFGRTFTEASLDCQIRSYLALKDIVRDNAYDFIALKCQQELSDHYAVQCLAVSLLNNTFDAEGPKRVIPCACEGDCDGALSMQIPQLLDESQPACLVDIRSYDEDTDEFAFANCGGMALAYARLDDSAAAMRKTIMMDHVFGKAGGGTTQFMTQGGPVTAARLFRKNGRYCMGVFEGLSVEHERDSLSANFCYPHAFIKADIDFSKFVQTMGANHMHFVFGSHASVLRDFCAVKDIEYIDFNS